MYLRASLDLPVGPTVEDAVYLLLTSGVCLRGTGGDTHSELARGVDEVVETCPALTGYHIHLLSKESFAQLDF